MIVPKPSVTVAASAYNEEENIKAFLESVLSQRYDGFKLEKILIISDGSTDKTAKIAKSFKNKIIKVLEYKERTGKSTRLNEIYSTLKSDFLVQSDADVVFSHPFIIRDMIKPLIKFKNVAMCAGNPTRIKGETFIEKAVNYSFEAYAPLRNTLRGGNNIFSVDGRLLAFRKELVKKIVVPYNMIGNDAYTYYCCLTLGYKYKFVESAIVFFRSPQTLKDHIRQNTRFLAAPIRMTRYFPKALVKQETTIPKNILIKELFIQFLKHPILCTYIFIINRYCSIKARILEKKLDALWAVASSTKKLEPQRI